MQRRQPRQQFPKSQGKTLAPSQSASSSGGFPRRQDDSSSSAVDKNTKQEKPVKRGSVNQATADASACITDDEKVVERVKRGLQRPMLEGPTSSEAAAVERGPMRGNEEGTGAPTESSSTNREEQVEDLESRFEIITKERLGTQQRIDALKQTLSVLQDPSEASGAEKSESDKVAAAIFANVLDVELGNDSGTYVEAVQSSDATVAPGGGGEGPVMHVVGEILGAPEPTVGESEPNVSTASHSGVPQPTHSVATTDDPKPTNVNQAEQTGSTVGPSPPSSSAVPGTATKVGRPKRQLAASFARNTS